MNSQNQNEQNQDTGSPEQQVNKNQNQLVSRPLRWYNDNKLVIFLLIFIWPLGLYGLWKNPQFSQRARYAISGVFVLIFLLLISLKENHNNINNSKPDTGKQLALEGEKQDQQVVLAKVKENQKLEQEEQREFSSIINSFRDQYKSASNSVKESSLRYERGVEISKILPDKKVSNWIGILKSVTGDKNAKLNILLDGAEDITIENKDGISLGTSLHSAIANLVEGEKVIFSGQFLPSDKVDYILENSYTQRGSMADPEFTINFSDIKSYFQINKAQVISEIKSAIDEKSLDKASSILESYSMIKNDELVFLANLLQREQKKEQEKQLLSQLNEIPETDYDELHNLYGKLYQLTGNGDYEQKMKQAQQATKLTQQQARQRQMDEQEQQLLAQLNATPETNYEQLENIYKELYLLTEKSDYEQKMKQVNNQALHETAAKEKAERQQQEGQLAKEFADKKDSILSYAKQLLDQGKYLDFFALYSKYKVVHDQQLDELNQKAQRMIEQGEDVLAAKSSCKRAAVNSAKYEGAESDFSNNSKVYSYGTDAFRVIGNDVKMKNAFNASRYVEYTGIYNIKERTCTIISVR